MLLGVGLDQNLGLPMPELCVLAHEAERLGFESVWTPAGQVPDAFHVCAMWAHDTSLIVGTAAVPAPRMWHPLSLAAQAATVAAIGGGRFVLGLGSGGAGSEYWRSLAMPNRPIELMRSYVSVTRGLLHGDDVEIDAPFGRGRQVRLDGLGRALTVPPIYLAALGEGMLRVAGEVADGVLLNWSTTSRIAESRRVVADAACAAGRVPSDVPLAMYVRMCIDDDVPAARRALALQLVAYAVEGDPASGAGYGNLFAVMGFADVVEALSALRRDGAPDEVLADAVPDAVLGAVGYWGTAPGARAALDRLSTGLDRAIVRIITVSPSVDRCLAAMRAVGPASVA